MPKYYSYHVSPSLDPSERMIQYMQLLADGMSFAEVRERLSVSRATMRVEMHVARSKLGAETTAHAVAILMRQGKIK